MDNSELQSEYKRLQENYEDAVNEAKKLAVTEALQAGVPVERVPYKTLKNAYDIENQAKKELDEFEIKHPGIS